MNSPSWSQVDIWKFQILDLDITFDIQNDILTLGTQKYEMYSINTMNEILNENLNNKSKFCPNLKINIHNKPRSQNINLRNKNENMILETKYMLNLKSKGL